MPRSLFVAGDFTAAEEASTAAAGAGPVAVIGTVAGAVGLAAAGMVVAGTAVAVIGAAVAGMAAADGVGVLLQQVQLWAQLRSAPRLTALATSSRPSGMVINMSCSGSAFANAFVADAGSVGFLKQKSFPRLSKS
jgi:hypothetical protein